LKIAEFMNLIEQGIYDPTSLMQSSPTNIMLGEINSSQTISNKGKAKLARDLRLYIEGGASALSAGKLQRLQSYVLSYSGFGSIDELLAADTAYQERLSPMLAAAQEASQGNFAAKLDMQAQVRNLLGDLPDASASGIAALRADEKTRLLRDMNLDVDEQRSDLLEVANAGGFNPGRPLGDLEEFRARATQDADLVALDRALALIGAQQGAAGGNLDLLLGGKRDTLSTSLAIAGADQGLVGGGAIMPPAPQNYLGQGISDAGTTIAQGFNDYYTAQQIAKEKDNYLPGYQF
jgi:hypothetical protein